ncbi:MAG: pyridine nucleotide-disulfide oxidoreductase, partial [Cupriavidus sp.]|nr:pyridine nucleotide-disulfide oxidoreductase [Cupriavidus sp.]
MTKRQTPLSIVQSTSAPRRAREVSAAPPVQKVPRARTSRARRNDKVREADLVVIGGGSAGVA